MLRFIPALLLAGAVVAAPLASIDDVKEAKADKCEDLFHSIETDTDVTVYEISCGHYVRTLSDAH